MEFYAAIRWDMKGLLKAAWKCLYMFVFLEGSCFGDIPSPPESDQTEWLQPSKHFPLMTKRVLSDNGEHLRS